VVDRLRLFVTPEHDCNYLPQQTAVTLFADPEFPKSPGLQALLAARGYRRSGMHLYRPHCPDCTACIPIRLLVADFKPSRSQQRCLEQNKDLDVRVCKATYTDERFALYCRYLSARHPQGGMDQSTPELFSDFLFCDWAQTDLVEFRAQDQLLAVAVCDCMPNALSAVYTFFDPEAKKRVLVCMPFCGKFNPPANSNCDGYILAILSMPVEKCPTKHVTCPTNNCSVMAGLRLKRIRVLRFVLERNPVELMDIVLERSVKLPRNHALSLRVPTFDRPLK